jgi:hypothetical protein
MRTKHIKSLCPLVVALVVFSTVLFGQNGVTVIGMIIDRNNAPLVNAYVSIAGVGRYTDVQGRYRLDDVPAGLQRMQVEQGQPGRVLMNISVDVHGPVARIDRTIP